MILIIYKVISIFAFCKSVGGKHTKVIIPYLNKDFSNLGKTIIYKALLYIFLGKSWRPC